MSSGLPSSFASAAAGQSRDARAGRGGSGSGSGEWSRRDGRSANGTLTFRRPSNAPFSHSQQASDITPVQTPAAENPPTLPPSMPTDGSLRYTKEQLLALAKAQAPSVDLSSLLVSGWNPGQVNGTPARGWGKTNENHVPQDPGVCWDANGQVKPIGLQEMSAEERELFSSDVNSTLKPPQQNKEGTHQGGNVNGRKASISHGSNYGMSSPSTASRPGTRRRETGDTNPFPGAGLASPTATGRFSRDDGPWFGRKSLDTKESTFEEPEEEQKPPSAARATSGFGNLVRDPAPGGNSGFGSAANLWGSATGTSSGAGMGGFGSFAMPTSAIGEKRVGLSRGESRLAHLIPKDSSENIVGKTIEPSSADPNRSWRSRPRTDTDPFAADDALGGRQDVNSPHQGQPYETPVKGSAVDFGMSGLNLGGEAEGSGSPQTNPYRSPPERGDHGADDAPGDMTSQGLGGIPDHMSNLNSISRGFPTGPFDGSDRSQTSSVGAKGFPAINTFGGWPSTVGTGTPDRERSGFGNAFGSSLFSPASDLQSPGGFGGMGMFGPASTSSIGAGGSMRQSKLGALFPAALQAQMQNQDQDNLSDTGSDFRQVNPLGAIGRASAGPARDTNSPLRRGGLEDVLSESTRSPGPFGTSGPAQHGLTTTAQPAPFQGSQPAGEPAGQHRSMVMPDRMRWVYLDPQGQIQGPFTGLEMNDWYKANFFTPDLRVKKIEDAEFEPLGQLIRRIGNSREPFLVPQMGIPHGPPASSGQQFPTGDRGVIPPLVGAFPSFGRTLTAEEQNNLERRKQEEQFMMARQREFMAQHTFPKMPMPGASGLPSALHHHSSAHSLQSQPSFGSIASPIGPNQPPVGAIGPNPAFFEAQTGATQPSGAQGASAEFELSMQERDVLANLQPSGAPNILQQGRSSDASSLRSNLPAADQLQKDTQGFSERLKEFHNLRAARDAAEEAAKNGGMATVNEELNEDPSHGLPNEAEVARMLDEAQAEELDMASLSLTQQVQKTQAAAAAAKQQPPPQDVWKQPADLPMPFPPPQQQGSTPIAAPTAQRTRSTLPDQYASRSRSETPESGVAAQPPPLAPWARDPGSESHKGPSLREIQEAEAKKAAKAEEQAAAARRAALEQEAAAIREREKAGAAVAPGLPTTSTWGNGSPVTTSSSSPWTKPAAAKVAPTNAASSSASAKKTLADIQREEEARKQRAAKDHASQAAKDHASQIAAAATSAMGKRYADLASKAQAPTTAAAMVASGAAPPAGSGWATVGAGGKVKIPTGPSAQSRSVSTGNVKPVPAAAPARPVVKQSVSTMAKTDAGSVAMDEFNKWVHRELSRGITGGIDVDTFAATLQNFPLEHQLIADAVYGSSTTMDGRHFADEYIRRKKLADRGVVEKQPAADAGKGAGAGGGWSEVAKKGGAAAGAAGGQGPQAGKEEGMPAGFKVVPGRKKGKK